MLSNGSNKTARNREATSQKLPEQGFTGGSAKTQRQMGIFQSLSPNENRAR